MIVSERDYLKMKENPARGLADIITFIDIVRAVKLDSKNYVGTGNKDG